MNTLERERKGAGGGMWEWGTLQDSRSGTLPPNSAITGYVTEGALLISANLSTDAVRTFRKVWIRIRPRQQHSVEARTYIAIRFEPSREMNLFPSRFKRLWSYSWCYGGGNRRCICRRFASDSFSCLLQTYCCLSINEELRISCVFGDL